MKYFALLFILLPLLGRSEQPAASVTAEAQQALQSNRHDVEIRVNVDQSSLGEPLKANEVPVKFTVKNVSKETVGMLHYGDIYRSSVGIFLADKTDIPNGGPFPFPNAGGGSIKKIEPGESIRFNVDVPIQLFKLDGKQLRAGIHYGTATFTGKAFSEPFSFPLLQ